jgi:hypothetical protein
MDASDIAQVKLLIKKRKIPSGKITSKDCIPDDKLGMVDLGIPFVFAHSLNKSHQRKEKKD